MLYRAAESLRWLCVLLYPVMPESAQGIYTQLGLGTAGTNSSLSAIDPAQLKWGGLKNTRIGEVKPLFPRIERKINERDQE